MKKRIIVLIAILMVFTSVIFIKTESHAARKSFRALAVTNGFFGEKTDFTIKYSRKKRRITLNGTMRYLKGKKGFKQGKKVRFRKKSYKVAKGCTYATAGGSVKFKKKKFIKYFKKHDPKVFLRGYISITVKNKKVVDVYVTD